MQKYFRGDFLKIFIINFIDWTGADNLDCVSGSSNVWRYLLRRVGDQHSAVGCRFCLSQLRWMVGVLRSFFQLELQVNMYSYLGARWRLRLSRVAAFWTIRPPSPYSRRRLRNICCVVFVSSSATRSPNESHRNWSRLPQFVIDFLSFRFKAAQ